MKNPRTDLSTILLVVNPVSGNRDKTDILQAVQTYIPKGSSLETYETTGQNDIEVIKNLWSSARPERVLVVGGDGTVKMILEALKDRDYVLGILPAGSSNGLATDLELPSNIEEAIQVALGDKIKKLDVLSLNQSLGLHISDLGINAELIEKYSKSEAHGYLAYLLESLPTLVETESPYEFTLRMDGKEYVHTARMIAFANSRKFGTGACINPHGRMDDGVFEVVIFKQLKLGKILQTLMGNLPSDPDFVQLYSTREVHVAMPRPVRFQIDGEYQGALKEVTVKILPAFVKVAVG